MCLNVLRLVDIICLHDSKGGLAEYCNLHFFFGQLVAEHLDSKPKAQIEFKRVVYKRIGY